MNENIFSQRVNSLITLKTRYAVDVQFSEQIKQIESFR